ncbi:hypothetical protein Bca4012_050604 [Brassica carinata]
MRDKKRRRELEPEHNHEPRRRISGAVDIEECILVLHVPQSQFFLLTPIDILSKKQQIEDHFHTFVYKG